MEQGRWNVALVRHRDDIALSCIRAHANRAGFLERLRKLPPATVDRIASSLEWDLGITRATLQGLAACGLVQHDQELSTWSAARAPRPPGAAAPLARAMALPDRLGDRLEDALLNPSETEAAELDQRSFEAFGKRLLPQLPELNGHLRLGGKVLGLEGSEELLGYLARRFPTIETLQRSGRHTFSCTSLGAVLALHAAPLDYPQSPERWFANVKRFLSRDGFVILRTLATPLTPPEPLSLEGRGWWHALSLLQAFRGGDGRAWSHQIALRAARRAGFRSLRSFSWAEDPGCVHLVASQGASGDILRPR